MIVKVSNEIGERFVVFVLSSLEFVEGVEEGSNLVVSGLYMVVEVVELCFGSLEDVGVFIRNGVFEEFFVGNRVGLLFVVFSVGVVVVVVVVVVYVFCVFVSVVIGVFR